MGQRLQHDCGLAPFTVLIYPLASMCTDCQMLLDYPIVDVRSQIPSLSSDSMAQSAMPAPPIYSRGDGTDKYGGIVSGR